MVFIYYHRRLDFNLQTFCHILDFPYIRQVIDIISFNISNDTSFYEKNEKKRLCIVLVIRTKNTIYDKKKELQTFKQKECSSF